MSANSGEATQLRKLLGGFRMRALGVQADADVVVVGDVAGVAGSLGDRRREGAHLELRLGVEQADFPRAGRIDRGTTEREEVLAVRIGLGFETVAEIVLPLGKHLVGLDPTGVGQLLLALDQRGAAFFALPVGRADVLVAHGGGFPEILRAHRHRDVGAVSLDLVENAAKNSASVAGIEMPSLSKASLL